MIRSLEKPCEGIPSPLLDIYPLSTYAVFRGRDQFEAQKGLLQPRYIIQDVETNRAALWTFGLVKRIWVLTDLSLWLRCKT